jgi:hypothetical protein
MSCAQWTSRVWGGQNHDIDTACIGGSVMLTQTSIGG